MVHVSMEMDWVFDWQCHPERPVQVANDDRNCKYNHFKSLSSILDTGDTWNHTISFIVTTQWNVMTLGLLKKKSVGSENTMQLDKP